MCQRDHTKGRTGTSGGVRLGEIRTIDSQTPELTGDYVDFVMCSQDFCNVDIETAVNNSGWMRDSVSMNWTTVEDLIGTFERNHCLGKIAFLQIVTASALIVL